jgi:hypothetical protein
VVAVEIDAGLVRALRAERLLPDNVELLHADALSIDLAALAGGRARLVGNLPYSVASPLLRRLLDLRGVLTDWSVMLQREVAARVLAAEGSRDYGSLAVLHALTARVEKRAELPGLFIRCRASAESCALPLPSCGSRRRSWPPWRVGAPPFRSDARPRELAQRANSPEQPRRSRICCAARIDPARAESRAGRSARAPPAAPRRYGVRRSERALAY